MHILIGLAMALALLYFWLLAHWYARILMFLVMAAALGAGGAGLGSLKQDGGFATVVIGLVGIGLAWPLAGIPVYRQRHQIRAELRREWMLKQQLLSTKAATGSAVPSATAGPASAR